LVIKSSGVNFWQIFVSKTLPSLQFASGNLYSLPQKPDKMKNEVNVNLAVQGTARDRPLWKLVRAHTFLLFQRSMAAFAAPDRSIMIGKKTQHNAYR